MLITIEGIDGVGKTTLINNLKQKIEYLNPVYTREPYGTMRQNICNFTGNISKQAVFFVMSHAEHIERLIESPKMTNRVIISERFFDSFIAYYCESMSYDLMKTVEYQKKISVIPDLTILLTCDPEVAQKRMSFELVYNDAKYLSNVQDNYLILSKLRPNIRCIDTTNKTETEVYKIALDIIKKYTQ